MICYDIIRDMTKLVQVDSSNSRRFTGFCHTEDVLADSQESDDEDNVTLPCDTFSSASLEDTHSLTLEVQDEECTDSSLYMSDEEDGNQHSGNELVSLLTTSNSI